MNRRVFLKIAGAGLAYLGGGCGLGQKQGKANQPNIVFLFTDDHAVQSISAYGSKINETQIRRRINIFHYILYNLVHSGLRRESIFIFI